MIRIRYRLSVSKISRGEGCAVGSFVIAVFSLMFATFVGGGDVEGGMKWKIISFCAKLEAELARRPCPVPCISYSREESLMMINLVVKLWRF